MKNFLPTSKGFTLIELMVVVSIMAILLVIGISFFANVIQKSARDARKKADIDAIAKVYETKFPTENKYIALTADDFANKAIPTPPEGGSYECIAGPDSGCKPPLTGEGFKVCATLADGTTSYCRSSTQGGLASKFDLATFFGNPPQYITTTNPSVSSSFTNVVNPAITITKPDNIIENDLLLAHIGTYLVGSYATITAPTTEWNLIKTLDQSPPIGYNGYIRSATYWKIAGSSEPLNYSWSLPSNPNTYYASGAISVYRGVNKTNPINAQNGQTTNGLSGSFSTPLVTPTVNNTTIATFFTNYFSYTFTTPSGMTEIYDSITIPFPGTVPGISSAYVTQAAAAAIFVTATASSSSTYGTSQIVVIKP